MKITRRLYEHAKALTSCLNDAIVSKGANVAKRPTNKRVRAWLRNGNEGQAVVEFAFAMPLLMLITTGIFAFGIAISNQLTLTQAVGIGAQYLQQIRTSSTDPCSDTFTAIQNAAPSLTPSNIRVTVTMNGVAPPQTGNSCAGAQSDLTPGVPVTVSATYPCPNLTVYNFNFGTFCPLSAKVTEYEY